MSTFDGSTLTVQDTPRLNAQLDATYEIMRDGGWRTLTDLAGLVREKLGRVVSTQSVSARLRDFRKEKFGGHTVERKYIAEGLFAYRLLVNGLKQESTNV